MGTALPDEEIMIFMIMATCCHVLLCHTKMLVWVPDAGIPCSWKFSRDPIKVYTHEKQHTFSILELTSAKIRSRNVRTRPYAKI